LVVAAFFDHPCRLQQRIAEACGHAVDHHIGGIAADVEHVAAPIGKRDACGQRKTVAFRRPLAARAPAAVGRLDRKRRRLGKTRPPQHRNSVARKAACA